MELQTTEVARMTAADFGVTIKFDGPESIELIDDIDAYLSVFAVPVKRESGTGFCFGNTNCIKCGTPLGGMLGSFQWGIVHGEGSCRSCGWPARAYHDIKDRNGVSIFERPLQTILQYHPSEVKCQEHGEKSQPITALQRNVRKYNAAMSTTKQKLVTTAEAAEITGIPERTLRTWCSTGYLPSVRYGRAYLVDVSDLKRTKRPHRGVKPKV